MLWTAIHLPNLTLECIPQAPDEAFAVVERRRIACASPAARAAGVRPGQGLAAALALLPTLVAIERDAAREAAALEALALWALQFTATVAPMVNTLLLESGGSLQLFGGLATLIERLRAGLAAQGLSATLASAPTPTGARMLAMSGFDTHLQTAAALRAALPGLPIGALEGAAGFAATFDTLGVRNLADLLALPRDGLARRFGPHLGEEIDRAFGSRPDPVRPLVVPERFHAAVALVAPIDSAAAVEHACRRAFEQLEGFLRAGRCAVGGIDLHLRHERRGRHDDDGAMPETHIGLRFFEPTAAAARFMLILSERLHHTVLARRVERIDIDAVPVRATESSASLLPAPVRAGHGLERLLERLHARLGADAISRPALQAEHRPARAGIVHAFDAAGTHPHATGARPHGAARRPVAASRQHDAAAWGPRPLWLVEPPQALAEIDGKPHHGGPLQLVAGPERIEAGWWDDAAMARDYFIARTEARALVWIFRDRGPATGWFLQGYFA
jgi:protein ImuB